MARIAGGVLLVCLLAACGCRTASLKVVPDTENRTKLEVWRPAK